MSVPSHHPAAPAPHRQEPAHRHPQPVVATTQTSAVAGPAAGIVALQRSLGNQHVQRLISRQVQVTGTTFAEAKEAILDAWLPFMIYDAIEKCTERPKLKADPAVQQALRANLDGIDLWKARLLLDYGSEAAYPPAVKEMWRAVGQGFFADVIVLKTLQKLSLADVTLLNSVPGLADLLRSMLSAKDFADAQGMLAGNYARQLARHKTNVTFVKAQLTAWKAPANPANLRNTAEWLYPSTPGVKSKNDIYVLTPTHDSATRATVHGKTNEVAYFGDAPAFPDDTADYDPDINSKRNIHFDPPSVAGAHLGRQIWVHNPSVAGAARLISVLVHEVQHDADRHDEEAGHDDKLGSPNESWNRYKTEFRAYWMDGQRDHLSTASNPALAPFDNAKQVAIFQHMWGSSPTDVYATWLRPNFTGNTTAYGEKFQDLVHRYARPEGVNLINSPRIDDFFLALGTCSQLHKSTAVSPLKELEAAARAFTAEDRLAVNATQARRLQEMMKDNLWPPVLLQIAMIVNGGMPPTWVSVNLAPARQRIEEAIMLWVDAGSIFDTIGKATPAEREQMKTDDKVRAAIFTHLSGRQLWQALLMLDYGPLNTWPGPITEIWTATQMYPYFVNKPMLRGALEKLSRPEIDRLARNEGLRGLIDGVLIGSEKREAQDVLAGGYADALGNHQQNRTAIRNALQALATGADPSWREHHATLADPAKAPIHAMTRTHDSMNRTILAGQTGDAYFGADTVYPGAARYDSQASSTKGIQFVASGTVRDIQGNHLYLYDARAIAAADLQTYLQAFAVSLP